MKTHTLGFIFNRKRDKVLLILKERPGSQKGKLNGIGGKLDVGESSSDCIARETREETSLDIAPKDWQKFGEIIMGESVDVDVYVTIFTGSESEARPNEDLSIDWYPVTDLPNNVMTNLRWLIPAALDFLNDRQLSFLGAKYEAL